MSSILAQLERDLRKTIPYSMQIGTTHLGCNKVKSCKAKHGTAMHTQDAGWCETCGSSPERNIENQGMVVDDRQIVNDDHQPVEDWVS